MYVLVEFRNNPPQIWEFESWWTWEDVKYYFIEKFNFDEERDSLTLINEILKPTYENRK